MLPRSSSLSSSLSLDTDKAQSSHHTTTTDSVSPTALLDAYGRPSIDSLAAAIVSERYNINNDKNRRDLYDEDEEEDDEDETAYSHHQGQLAPGEQPVLNLA